MESSTDEDHCWDRKSRFPPGDKAPQMPEEFLFSIPVTVYGIVFPLRTIIGFQFSKLS
ncbi:unnamed protein product [Larinioides sclopetarius]|uniref:Uncharacterized protein n=1 Tax=Larinioides sclopetarius TaxID=280406 RepID=A0AAV1YVX2_9ARAC